jgi:predicted porin
LRVQRSIRHKSTVIFLEMLGVVMRDLRKMYLGGAAPAVLSLFLMSSQASAQATLDDVVKRLDALEKSNDKLKKENEELKKRVNATTPKASAKVETTQSEPLPPLPLGPAPVFETTYQPTAGVLVAPSGDRPRANPVLHEAAAPSPGGGLKDFRIGDNTTVSLYGHADVSFDYFSVGVFDQGWKPAIASNSSYFGVRARHNLDPYGYPGFAIVLQYEELVEVSAIPTERAAFGSRDSFIGIESPIGALKVGKSDTPYKKATAAFDPFANTIGDYNAIMGNTGGDNRAEFDWRMSHSIWYESPTVHGFQFSALYSPGQNFANDNSDFAYGDFNCTGSTPRGSGSGFPSGSPIGVGACNDGNWGNAASAAVVYRQGPFTGIAAYEWHENVNRTGDETPNNGFQTVSGIGVHNEWAAKVGGGYRFNDPLGPLQLYGYYEWLRREHTTAEFNERSRDGWYLSATQYVGNHWTFSAAWAHAGNTPGNPAALSPNDPSALAGAIYQANLFSDAANMYALGTRYNFNQWASWYLVGADLTQGQGAHYCLGASGHGYQLCSRDANNDTIGGATIKGVSTGLTFTF